MRSLFYVSLFLSFFSSISLADHRTTPSRKYRSPCKVQYLSDDMIEWECHTLKKGETLEKLFGARWKDVARFNRIDRRHAYPGVSLKIPKHLEEIENFTPMPEEYPPSRGEAKFILIDLSEQYLAAYEYGRQVFSLPIASGEKVNGNETPIGEFKITGAHLNHKSSLYSINAASKATGRGKLHPAQPVKGAMQAPLIEDTESPYPMNYALRFYVNRSGVSFWLHGRDIPGYPASHGCIGLYDEAMQKEYYGTPRDPQLVDARVLYEWVLGKGVDSGKEIQLKNGPKVLIIGQAP